MDAQLVTILSRTPLISPIMCKKGIKNAHSPGQRSKNAPWTSVTDKMIYFPTFVNIVH